ncbi:uncharacterized protein LOC112345595 [Selaginella moellendorffii]|uniref:uncharacterized protein LOC112345595 n=1 Tax=Selaginella moellendorffii TaxID=88036 RepID=UPI000D1CDCD8|nr:uncharacterized protein LOC112345595 [Selaginella moellendorffii]|eukprot:XP_024528487.1 uncharacterized protein LOC112345595 [Selaginella moellendorffii]
MDLPSLMLTIALAAPIQLLFHQEQAPPTLAAHPHIQPEFFRGNHGDDMNHWFDHFMTFSNTHLDMPSLSYHETLMSCSPLSTSSELNEAKRAKAGVEAGLVRLLVGYIGMLE